MGEGLDACIYVTQGVVGIIAGQGHLIDLTNFGGSPPESRHQEAGN